MPFLRSKEMYGHDRCGFHEGLSRPCRRKEQACVIWEEHGTTGMIWWCREHAKRWAETNAWAHGSILPLALANVLHDKMNERLYESR